MKPRVSDAKQAERFFINVLWNWTAVGANIFTGIFLTPYLIKKLGVQRWGTWTIVFALIEYIFLFDLGFRSAIVNFVSRYRVVDDSEGVNGVINTALAYFLGVAGIVVILTLGLAGQGYRYFKIAPEDHGDFTFLLLIVGFTWAIGVVSNIFQASLEAFQQFKIYNHIFIVMLVLRAGGCALLLFLGQGLRGLGLCVMAAQFFGYAAMFFTFRRAFPELRFARRFVSSQRWKQMARYGVNSVIASSGSLFLNQGPPLLIGHLLPVEFAGYYTFPSRLLNYVVEMITRIGFVTVPKTAELYALGRTEQIIQLGTHLNRYCLALFLPISIFMAVFGRALVVRWMGVSFAEHVAPLLPIFAVSVALAISAQFNSNQILFGMAKHGSYAISIVVESLTALVGMVLILPHFGIQGAAMVAVFLTLINRGLITPIIVCKQLNCSYFRYMAAIYTRPMICGIPTLAAALWMKSMWLPGSTWFQLGVAMTLIGLIGLILSLFICVEPEHRAILVNTLRKRLGIGHGGLGSTEVPLVVSNTGDPR